MGELYALYIALPVSDLCVSYTFYLHLSLIMIYTIITVDTHCRNISIIQII